MGESHQVEQSVCHEIAITCRDALGRPHLLLTEHVYDPAEPFAITILFHTREMVRPWTFSRELLILGQSAPVGDGDVRIWPAMDVDGVPVVAVRLSSPDGSILVEALAQDVQGFLAASIATVPRGAESRHLDLDALIEEILTAH